MLIGRSAKQVAALGKELGRRHRSVISEFFRPQPYQRLPAADQAPLTTSRIMDDWGQESCQAGLADPKENSDAKKITGICLESRGIAK